MKLSDVRLYDPFCTVCMKWLFINVNNTTIIASMYSNFLTRIFWLYIHPCTWNKMISDGVQWKLFQEIFPIKETTESNSNKNSVVTVIIYTLWNRKSDQNFLVPKRLLRSCTAQVFWVMYCTWQSYLPWMNRGMCSCCLCGFHTSTTFTLGISHSMIITLHLYTWKIFYISRSSHWLEFLHLKKFTYLCTVQSVCTLHVFAEIFAVYNFHGFHRRPINWKFSMWGFTTYVAYS